jgi:RNA polymerase sigma-70 factor (ECF subfamily)
MARMTLQAASAGAIPASREQSLVERARDMDPEAWDEIFCAHHEAIHRYIALRLDDATAAEDLAADVFVEAVKSIGRYRYRGIAFRAWLYRIAHNITADHRRRLARRPAVPIPEAGHASCAVADFAGGLASRDEVRMAIEQLTDEQQQVVVLRFFEGLSVGEAAEAMGRREGAIKALQHRALKRLKVLMEAGRE